MEPDDARPEPSRRLPPQARTLWRIEGALRWGGAAIGVGLVTGGLGDELPGIVVTLAWLAVAIGAVVDVGVVPGLRWSRWRYEVREDEIDLRRGTFTVVRTLVPMARVQHVDSSRGLLEQSLGIATVVFHTAAGASVIPALTQDEAVMVRDRIARLTRTTPDEL